MLSPEMAPRVLARSLRMRCPRCGKGAVMRKVFTTHDDCQVCGLRFAREEGFWIGAIFVNLITTQILIVAGLFALMFGTDLSLWRQVGILVGVGVLFPILFYPMSMSIWLGMNHFFTDKPSQQHETRR